MAAPKQMPPLVMVVHTPVNLSEKQQHLSDLRVARGGEAVLPLPLEKIVRALEVGAPLSKGRIVLQETTCEDNEEMGEIEKSKCMAAETTEDLLRLPSVRAVLYCAGRAAQDACAILRKDKRFKDCVQFYPRSRPWSCCLRDGDNQGYVEVVDASDPYVNATLTLGVVGDLQTTIVRKLAPWLETKPRRSRLGVRKLTSFLDPE